MELVIIIGQIYIEFCRVPCPNKVFLSLSFNVQVPVY